MSDVVVYRFRKSRREEVIARLTTFKGVELIDIRVFVEDDRGESRPTPKGISIRVDQAPQLRATIEAVTAATA